MFTLTQNQSLQVILAGAVSTNECPIVVSFEEVLDNGTARKLTQTALTTSGVAVVALQGIPEGRRITAITLYNADTASITLTFRFVDNGTIRIVRKHSLLTLQAVNWNPETGWYSTDASGNRMTSSAAADSAGISTALSQGVQASSQASVIDAVRATPGSSQASSLASGIVIASLNSVSSQASSIALGNPLTVSSIQSVLSTASFTNTTWSTVSSAVSRVKSSFTW